MDRLGVEMDRPGVGGGSSSNGFGLFLISCFLFYMLIPSGCWCARFIATFDVSATERVKFKLQVDC